MENLPSETNLLSTVLVTVVSAAAVGLLGWIVAKSRAVMDRRAVYSWLKTNTRDWPHESHATTEVIAKGTGMPDKRVRCACMSDRRIYRYSQEQKESWSIWREKPESIYNKRGILRV